ncbi:UNVERIFIED_CONTAM: hypothetical protein ABIC26_001083 [Paenibacillus sp. PvR008]
MTVGLWEFTVLEKNSHQIDTIEAVKKQLVNSKMTTSTNNGMVECLQINGLIGDE